MRERLSPGNRVKVVDPLPEHEPLRGKVGRLQYTLRLYHAGRWWADFKGQGHVSLCRSEIEKA